jgi:hypothetical protein
VGFGSRTPFPSFSRTKKSSEAIEALCTFKRAKMTPTLRPVADVLCSDDGEAPDLRIELTGTTKCGLPTKVIACALPNGTVQLNVARFDYVMEGGRHLIKTRSELRTVDGQFVFLHEAGHWLGLPHSENGEAHELMGPSPFDDSCLGDSELIRMRSAIDAGWDGRLKVPHALTLAP